MRLPIKNMRCGSLLINAALLGSGSASLADSRRFFPATFQFHFVQAYDAERNTIADGDVTPMANVAVTIVSPRAYRAGGLTAARRCGRRSLSWPRRSRSSIRAWSSG